MQSFNIADRQSPKVDRLQFVDCLLHRLDLPPFLVSRSPFMAQPSTTYKFELNLTDLDRSVYESVKQTIARRKFLSWAPRISRALSPSLSRALAA